MRNVRHYGSRAKVGIFFSQPPALMAEPDPSTNMVAFIRTTDSKKYVDIPYVRTVTIGRPHKADLQIMGDRISSIHVEIKMAEGRNAGSVIVRDVSQKGTGLLRPGQRPHEAAALPGDTEMVVLSGSGLVVPMRRPSAGRNELQVMEKIIWLETPTSHHPDKEQRRGQEHPMRKRPPTLPTSWTSLPEDVQDVWQDEGIEDVADF